jgi:hypothetical protein
MKQANLGVPALAIAAPVKGEATYLLEWIAYHPDEWKGWRLSCNWLRFAKVYLWLP